MSNGKRENCRGFNGMNFARRDILRGFVFLLSAKHAECRTARLPGQHSMRRADAQRGFHSGQVIARVIGSQASLSPRTQLFSPGERR